jgi:tripartite-type tricarboxylate transporter receptor subunit TctC
MKLPRRRFLHLTAGAAALPTISRIARAQTYPTRPVRLILGYAPGSAPDIVARLIGQWLSERLGQPFIIENRPGAGTNIGTDAVVRASPDGYTLLYVTTANARCHTANASNVTLFENLKFNFMRAKANPGRLNFGSSKGGTVHLSGELFKMMSGVNIVHVAYSNQMQAVTDLFVDRIQVSFDVMPTTIEYARTSKLRALAVTTATRSPALPDIPTVGDFVPGYEASSWHGVGVPKDTPAEIVEKLNRGIDAVLTDPKLKARLADLGGVPMPMTRPEFGKFIANETEKWGKVIKFAGIKPD